MSALSTTETQGKHVAILPATFQVLSYPADTRHYEDNSTDHIRRRQCDVQRPCTLCLRAGATCSATARPTVWKNRGPGQSTKPSRPIRESPVEVPAAKRRRRGASVEVIAFASSAPSTASPPPGPGTSTGIGTQTTQVATEDQSPSPPRETNSSPWISSSAAVQFMEEVRSICKPCAIR